MCTGHLEYLHIVWRMYVQILRAGLHIPHILKCGLLQRMCFQNHEKGGDDKMRNVYFICSIRRRILFSAKSRIVSGGRVASIMRNREGSSPARSR